MHQSMRSLCIESWSKTAPCVRRVVAFLTNAHVNPGASIDAFRNSTHPTSDTDTINAAPRLEQTISQLPILVNITLQY